MIDRIVLLRDKALVIYTNRGPVTLTPKPGENLSTFIRWFLTPSKLTLTEFTSAVSQETDDTKIIENPLLNDNKAVY